MNYSSAESFDTFFYSSAESFDTFLYSSAESFDTFLYSSAESFDIFVRIKTISAEIVFFFCSFYCFVILGKKYELELYLNLDQPELADMLKNDNFVKV